MNSKCVSSDVPARQRRFSVKPESDWLLARKRLATTVFATGEIDHVISVAARDWRDRPWYIAKPRHRAVRRAARTVLHNVTAGRTSRRTSGRDVCSATLTAVIRCGKHAHGAAMQYSYGNSNSYLLAALPSFPMLRFCLMASKPRDQMVSWPSPQC